MSSNSSVAMSLVSLPSLAPGGGPGRRTASGSGRTTWGVPRRPGSASRRSSSRARLL
ncbi:predicted protein [Streptomyces lividans TK24]|nr:predicted protein [Streptomyces lividans TK24]